MAHRITLITGANRGIGRATAERLARDGHHVIGLARHAPADGFPGEFHEVDLADAARTAEVLARITAAHQVDHVVNNAGLTTSSTLQETTPAELDRILALGLRAPMQCAQACLPGMIAKGRGAIVNISSRAALGMARRTAYAGAKSGLIGMTRTWALELGRHGITVNAVAPGPVLTELYRNNNPMDEEAARALAERIPLRRLGQPEDIAGTIAFFLSDDARFVTGQVLYACGGLSVGSAPI
ncbi:SDR family oxidoreductase [Bordetella genomosp. 11]|uniref:Short-chain dehydrogenase n=1 Tax=Bordetella genomosp. 11 TaxID=1416808 RepID=A0A261UFN7_9BORD|nr:SDR family oxidoreductase [Bordetella genomosp. 11]OZI60748.1 short-chain dehydrogenase [Bordetella genomosp. 11]